MALGGFPPVALGVNDGELETAMAVRSYLFSGLV